MLIAMTTADGGKKRLVLGLHQENVDRLLNDMPILKQLDGDPLIPGLEEWEVAILGPEDTARFVAHARASGAAEG